MTSQVHSRHWGLGEGKRTIIAFVGEGKGCFPTTLLIPVPFGALQIDEPFGNSGTSQSVLDLPLPLPVVPIQLHVLLPTQHTLTMLNRSSADRYSRSPFPAIHWLCDLE